MSHTIFQFSFLFVQTSIKIAQGLIMSLFTSHTTQVAEIKISAFFV